MILIGNEAVNFQCPHETAKLIKHCINRSEILGTHGNLSDVLVYFNLEEMQELAKIAGHVVKVPSPIEYSYAWPGMFKPFDHQRDTSRFLTLHQRAFCFNEAGTGKTSAAIWAADYLMQMGIFKRVLVICPLSIMDAAWRADLFSFAMHRTVGIAYGSAERRRKIIATQPEFLIINYDGVEIVKSEIMAAGYHLNSGHNVKDKYD